MGRHDDGADEDEGNTEEGTQSQQRHRQTQQENPGEATTRPTGPAPATPAGQSSARGGTATMTGIVPSPQEVLATERTTNDDEASEGGETKIDDEETQAQQRSSLSRLSSDAPVDVLAPVGTSCTIPTFRRRQGYRLSTEKHPDNPHLFYPDGRGRQKNVTRGRNTFTSDATRQGTASEKRLADVKIRGFGGSIGDECDPGLPKDDDLRESSPMLWSKWREWFRWKCVCGGGLPVETKAGPQQLFMKAALRLRRTTTQSRYEPMTAHGNQQNYRSRTGNFRYSPPYQYHHGPTPGQMSFFLLRHISRLAASGLRACDVTGVGRRSVLDSASPPGSTNDDKYCSVVSAQCQQRQSKEVVSQSRADTQRGVDRGLSQNSEVNLLDGRDKELTSQSKTDLLREAIGDGFKSILTAEFPQNL
ncbi:hypothetical protein THAOC_19418 [Thalassiosira oceanica]|uniref:Uncharacterized protein n=1 Tax=Thalassiosira oceanica TaxID=159749 RepID=K0S4U7_THAOC|nr:hypothetical protein THAOC_19418 [Thalassiosira oceanica]|eukprot:EJK60260.1 hypothetical protein THAOC_19418 [Thalassiosira oceanica]